MTSWRVGAHYGIHVYEGDRPVATFHTVADARLCVEAVNGVAEDCVNCAAFTSLRDAISRTVADHYAQPYQAMPTSPVGQIVGALERALELVDLGSTQ